MSSPPPPTSQNRFEQELEDTVNWSDRLGYIYWFAVLTTISCGFATGIHVTLTNRNAMLQSCQQKFEAFDDFLAGHQITNSLSDSNRSNHSYAMDIDAMATSTVEWNRDDRLEMPDNIELLMDRIDEMSSEIR